MVRPHREIPGKTESPLGQFRSTWHGRISHLWGALPAGIAEIGDQKNTPVTRKPIPVDNGEKAAFSASLLAVKPRIAVGRKDTSSIAESFR